MSDPRAPHDPHAAREECARLRTKLEAMTDLYEQAVMDYVEAEQAWSKADADAWIDVKDELGSVDEQGRARLVKDFQTRVDRRCRTERDGMEAARKTMQGLESRIASTERQLSAAQSELKSIQAELDLGRYGGVDTGTGEIHRPPRPPLPEEPAA